MGWGPGGMVIGDGMIAKAFSAYKVNSEVAIFASGVANSLESDPAQFKRELDLLENVRHEYPQRLLVYFSTCSVSDPDRVDTPYVIHKNNIEDRLAKWGKPYLILRLPAVIGKTNLAKTFPYFLYSKIHSGEIFDIWSNAVRYPIDVDDVLRISDQLISDSSFYNQYINIALRPYPVMEIAHEMEKILGKKTKMNLLDRGCFYELERSLALNIADSLDIYYGDEYLARMLQKYFA